MNLPRELVEAVRKHQVVPFVGAGVSMGVKRGLFPSWKQLLEGLAEKLEHEALPEPVIAEVRQRIAAEEFLEAAELGFQELGAFRFNRFLRERLRVRRPSDADLSVVRALWSLRPEVMLTTNYDDVLLWGREGAEPISNDQDDELNLMDSEASPDTPRLWYLHGTIHRLSTLILGGSDYARLYGDESQKGEGRYSHYKNALVRLREWIRSRPFLYVGFSFSDAHVLKQLEHVLGITKGRHLPSYALMKKGSLERGVLWPRYNIQLIEYEDHGPPLVACLNALSLAAFGPTVPAPAPVGPLVMPFSQPSPQSGFRSPAQPPPRSPMPAPGFTVLESKSSRVSPSESPVAQVASTVPLEPGYVPRPGLEREYARILQSQHRLVLLAPEEGGARSLARRVAKPYGERVSWLDPPNLPDCTEADYCRALAGSASVASFDALMEHLRERAGVSGREHLFVLGHDWGPSRHLDTLGGHLRKLLEEPAKGERQLLIAGGERAAWLLHHGTRPSVYEDAPLRAVPDFTVDEVRELIAGVGLDGKRWAGELHLATGGHPGLLEEALLGAGALDGESVTARLANSPSVRGALLERLREDERKGVAWDWSCRFVLEELLAGRSVEALESLAHRTEHPEVRLYFSGLVRADETGRTVPRCQAVVLAARDVLAHKAARR